MRACCEHVDGLACPAGGGQGSDPRLVVDTWTARVVGFGSLAEDYEDEPEAAA